MVDKLVLPELGENIDIADVSAVLVAVGDKIQRDQPVIEVETEKASLEVPASSDGRVTELLVRAGDKIKVGQVILVIETEPGDATETGRKKEPIPRKTQPVEPEARTRTAEPVVTPAPGPVPPAAAFPRPPLAIVDLVPAAPSVRALARELGVKIREVPGSGRAGRISRDDVKAQAKRLILAAGSGAPSLKLVPLPDFSKWGVVRREPLSKVRRVTAANMTQAWSSVPHVTQFDSADVTDMEATRKEFNLKHAGAEGKLTPTAVVLETVARALREFPRFNASLDPDAGELIFKEYLNLGVAVETDRGLLVPVLRDADRKPLLEISAELADLARRARTKKIRPDELTGATFTVSNLGGLGTTYFSPIVNWPEVAILGVGRGEIRAVFLEGEFRPRTILPLSLSYDHRVIDGAEAARFLRWLAEALARPPVLPEQDPPAEGPA